MSLVPTLLLPGSLRVPAGHSSESPIAYIVGWIKVRMPEFGARAVGVKNRVLVVRSETGSGKSTVMPVHVFRIFRHERTARGDRYRGASVLCTQPRVLTAVDLATRQVAGAVHNPDMVLGETVGYQTGPFSEKPPAGLVFATVGVLAALLRVLDDGQIMEKFRVIIIDEAHERSCETDATLMRLKQFYVRNADNPRLPFLVLASATIDAGVYARFFGAEAVVEVAGRTHPVVTKWPARGTNNYPQSAAEVALEIHDANPSDPPESSDILIFMPGMREIALVQQALESHAEARGADAKRDYIVLVLDRASVVNESAHFEMLTAPWRTLPRPATSTGKAPVRRIIVSTVVAETGSDDSDAQVRRRLRVGPHRGNVPAAQRHRSAHAPGRPVPNTAAQGARGASVSG
jgi:HrpA-like RNA helicase